MRGACVPSPPSACEPGAAPPRAPGGSLPRRTGRLVRARVGVGGQGRGQGQGQGQGRGQGRDRLAGIAAASGGSTRNCSVRTSAIGVLPASWAPAGGGASLLRVRQRALVATCAHGCVRASALAGCDGGGGWQEAAVACEERRRLLLDGAQLGCENTQRDRLGGSWSWRPGETPRPGAILVCKAQLLPGRRLLPAPVVAPLTTMRVRASASSARRNGNLLSLGAILPARVGV